MSHMSHPTHARKIIMNITPGPEPAATTTAGRRAANAVFLLVMHREVAAGAALAADMNKKEKVAAVARIEAELARATRRRDRALATYQQSRAAVGRVMEGVM